MTDGERRHHGEPDLIVGIDLGTTNSLVAVCDPWTGQPRVLADDQGRALLPSVVRFGEPQGSPDGRSGQKSEVGGQPPIAPGVAPGISLTPSPSHPITPSSTIVGWEARQHAVEFPTRTVYSVKRLMGRGLADVPAEDLKHLTYEVVDGSDARGGIQGGVEGGVRGDVRGACVKIDDRLYLPQEISAMILRALKAQAEARLEQPVKRAVITVPAYFDDAQRQATRDAGRLAGLEVVRIVNEPTAAALAYGIGIRGQRSEVRGQPDPKIIAVYDLGGGTFDVSILRVTPGASECARGDGGESFFEVLSTAGDTHLGGDDVDQMIAGLVQREIPQRFGTAIEFPPQTRQALRNFAEATKIRLSTEVSAMMRVDLGEGRVFERVLRREELEAMMRPWVARTIRGCERALRDAKLKSEQIDRVVLVGGMTRAPLVRQAVSAYFGREPYTALDPDQVVALGAAVQASILAGHPGARDMLLLDVIPLSLGIETVGGAVAKIVMRNTTVPTRATEMFSTSVDGQTSVKLHVLQGERELVKDCRSLGEFHLRGIPPMPAGIPQIEVEFLVDANGILNVSAVERRSGKRASIQVVPRHGLTAEEVQRMERESIAHAREDMHAHRVIDLAVNAALDLKWIRDAMGRVQGQLESAYQAALESKMRELAGFIEASRERPTEVDAEAFARCKQALDELSVRLHEIAIAASLRE